MKAKLRITDDARRVTVEKDTLSRDYIRYNGGR